MVNDEIKFVIYNNNITLDGERLTITRNKKEVYNNTFTEIDYDYSNFVFSCTGGDVVKIPKLALKKCSIKIDNGEQE